IAGESSYGRLFRVDLAAGQLSLVAQMPYNFDAVFEDANHLLISAATCGYNCGNDILRVDVTSGAQTLVAQVPGASGPLARSSNGDLYYAVQSSQSPPPPGSIRIVRWGASQLASGTVLTLMNAQNVASGFDGVAALAFEDRLGHLLVAESRF